MDGWGSPIEGLKAARLKTGAFQSLGCTDRNHLQIPLKFRYRMSRPRSRPETTPFPTRSNVVDVKCCRLNFEAKSHGKIHNLSLGREVCPLTGG